MRWVVGIPRMLAEREEMLAALKACPLVIPVVFGAAGKDMGQYTMDWQEKVLALIARIEEKRWIPQTLTKSLA